MVITLYILMTVSNCSQCQLISEGKYSVYQHTDLNFRIRLKRFTMIVDQRAQLSSDLINLGN